MFGPHSKTALTARKYACACLLLSLVVAEARAQQNVYPYPATQPSRSIGRGFGSGPRSVFQPQFQSQPQLQSQFQTGSPTAGGGQLRQRPQIGIPGQPAIGFQNQPATFAPFAAAPNQNQPQLGFGPQTGLAPQVGFGSQAGFGNQPGFFPQPGLGAQPGFGPQNGIPAGAIPADIDVFVQRGETGRIVAGGTLGSDNGFVGEVILDERDFNIFAFPRSLADLRNPRVFRGLGQSLRAEIVPGTDVERYLISFGDPYFLNSNTSLNVSGYYFDRQFFDWDEQRAGAKIRLGQSLTNFLSISGGLTLENVEIDNPRLTTSPQLNDDLGNNNLFLFDIGLVYDTRQSPFLLDSGSYLSLKYQQAFGDFSYARGEIDYRVQRLIFQRTPTTGHHTLSFRTQLGFSGSSTPVFENFLGGGFSSLRGFDFRGIGPLENGVRVGGEFQWLNSLEYQFPITNDDMVMGVAFLDFGTIEESVEINSDNFRIAPGVGLRINVPFAGISAPLALDFAFPTDEAAGDDKRGFSWLIGFVR